MQPFFCDCVDSKPIPLHMLHFQNIISCSTIQSSPVQNIVVKPAVAPYYSEVSSKLHILQTFDMFSGPSSVLLAPVLSDVGSERTVS